MNCGLPGSSVHSFVGGCFFPVKQFHKPIWTLSAPYSHAFSKKSAISDMKRSTVSLLLFKQTHGEWSEGEKWRGKLRGKNRGFLLTEPENIPTEWMPISPLSIKQMKTRPQLSHVTSSLDSFTCSHFTDFNEAGIWIAIPIYLAVAVIQDQSP